MKIRQFTLAGLACIFSFPAFAQEWPGERPAPSDGWEFSLGGGLLFSPNYLGDDDYILSAVPYIRIKKGDRFVASIEEGVKYAAISGDNFRLGPRVSLEFPRDEDGSAPFRVAGERTNDLLGLGDVNASVSLGGFAEVDIGDFTASANLGKAVTGHDGLTGDVALNYKGRIQRNGPPIIYALGPRFNFANDQYHEALFGVTAVQSAASGLPEFEASGGGVSYGAGVSVIVPVTDNVSTTFIGSYDRLMGDAARSPLVTERGSRDQGFVGLVASYTFK